MDVTKENTSYFCLTLIGPDHLPNLQVGGEGEGRLQDTDAPTPDMIATVMIAISTMSLHLSPNGMITSIPPSPLSTPLDQNRVYLLLSNYMDRGIGR
jgi:hypothetical protein